MRRNVRSTECTAPFQYYKCAMNGFSGCCSNTQVCDLDDCPEDSRPPSATTQPTTSANSYGSTECKAPYQYYACQKNGFSWCCSDTRVCDLEDCPASSKPSSPTSSIRTTTHVSSVVSVAIGTAAPRPSPTVSTKASKASASSHSSASDTSNIVADTTVKSHKTSKTPIVAGTVGGIVGLILVIAILVLFCALLKKRRKRKEDEKRMLGYYVPPGARIEGLQNDNGT